MRNSGRSSLFLMELMIAFLIFSVCACVCAAIIAAAWSDISQSRDMSNALIIAQNEAELIKGGQVSDSTKYYDSGLAVSDSESAAYSATMTLSPSENGLTGYKVEVFRASDNKLIYTVDSAYYAF